MSLSVETDPAAALAAVYFTVYNTRAYYYYYTLCVYDFAHNDNIARCTAPAAVSSFNTTITANYNNINNKFV